MGPVADAGSTRPAWLSANVGSCGIGNGSALASLFSTKLRGGVFWFRVLVAIVLRLSLGAGNPFRR